MTSDGARWRVLAAFALAGALPQFLWSTFPPVMTVVAGRYGLGAALASLPVIAFSIGAVLAAPVAGATIDRRGYLHSIRLGLALVIVAGSLRAVDGPFWLVVLSQGGIGAAFAFIAASTTSLVIDWFDEADVPIATGLCVLGLFVGLGAGMVATPYLVSGLGFHGMMLWTAGGTAVGAILAVALISARSPTHVPAGPSADTRDCIAGISHNRVLMLLLFMSFASGGAFSAVATALEPIWTSRGRTIEDAGLANGLFILGGALGTFLLPLAQRRIPPRTLLIVCAVVVLLLAWPLLVAPTMLVGMMIASVVGVFWLGNVPVALTILETAAPPSAVGAASSAFWAANNLGSVALVWLFNDAAERWSWQFAAVGVLAILAAVLAATLALPHAATRRRSS